MNLSDEMPKLALLGRRLFLQMWMPVQPARVWTASCGCAWAGQRKPAGARGSQALGKQGERERAGPPSRAEG